MLEDREYLEIVKDIINNEKFQLLKFETHHFTNNRYEHCLNVSYLAYKIGKKFNLDYISLAKAGLFHDFYLDNELEGYSKNQKLIFHPIKALENSLSLTHINKLEQDIILSHMYPFGNKKPIYKESYILDIIDDLVSIKERFSGDARRVTSVVNFVFIVFINFIKYKV